MCLENILKPSNSPISSIIKRHKTKPSGNSGQQKQGICVDITRPRLINKLIGEHINSVGERLCYNRPIHFEVICELVLVVVEALECESARLGDIGGENGCVTHVILFERPWEDRPGRGKGIDEPQWHSII